MKTGLNRNELNCLSNTGLLLFDHSSVYTMSTKKFKVKGSSYWFFEFHSGTVSFIELIFQTKLVDYTIIYKNSSNIFFITPTISEKYQLQNFSALYFTLLIIIFINDIYQFLDCGTMLFVDDLKLYRRICKATLIN